MQYPHLCILPQVPQLPTSLLPSCSCVTSAPGWANAGGRSAPPCSSRFGPTEWRSPSLLPACLPSLKPCCSFLHAPLQCLLLGTGDDAGGPRWRCNHTVKPHSFLQPPCSQLIKVDTQHHYHYTIAHYFLGCQVYSLC